MPMNSAKAMRLFAAFLVFAVATVPLRAVADAGHSKMHPGPKQGAAVEKRNAKEMKMQEMVQKAPRLHILHLAGEQSMYAQQMSMYALLAALRVEPRENLARLRAVRDTFERVRIGLRAGDDGLGLPATTESGILVHLDSVDGLWSQLDPVVEEVLESGKVREDQIESFATLIPQLHEALDKIIASYEYYAYGGRRFSILLSTIAVAEGQQTRIPKMTTEFLFSAYGHEVAKNKRKLSDTYTEFDRALKGLMEGDPDLRVLAAPTEEIKVGYQTVQQLWQRFQPLMNGDLGSGKGDRQAIAQLAQRVLPLADEFHEVFHETLNLYHDL